MNTKQTLDTILAIHPARVSSNRWAIRYQAHAAALICKHGVAAGFGAEGIAALPGLNCPACAIKLPKIASVAGAV